MQEMNRVDTAYVLWLGCLLQVHGLQRLYNGKMLTGLLWLFTFGLFGFGQLVDLFLIPRMVDDYNTQRRSRYSLGPADGVLAQGGLPQANVQRVLETGGGAIAPELAANQLMVQLLEAASTRQGRLSVTQGVMATGAGFKDVEATLLGMVKTGYADITNDPATGVVLYEFKELI
jgi:TM2 domain-containing membrane protein YozV